MGFFSTFFGPRYSQREHYLSEQDLDRILWSIHQSNIDNQNKQAVKQAVLERRHGDGKISLQQIYETLRKLENKYVISIYDRKDFMKVFEKYFDANFGK